MLTGDPKLRALAGSATAFSLAPEFVILFGSLPGGFWHETAAKVRKVTRVGKRPERATRVYIRLALMSGVSLALATRAKHAVSRRRRAP